MPYSLYAYHFKYFYILTKMELYLLQLSSHKMGFLRHSCTQLNSTPRHNKQQLQKNTHWETGKSILNLEERCGKNEEGEGAQQGEV